MSPAPSCRKEEGSLNQGVFTLVAGMVVKVPAWAIGTALLSKHAEAFSDTPHYMPIERVGSGRYRFINPAGNVGLCHDCQRLSTDPVVKKISARPPRKVLFVPADLKGGDKIRIVWVEKKSACAVLVEEIIEERGFPVIQQEGTSEAVAFHHPPLDGSSEAIQTPV